MGVIRASKRLSMTPAPKPEKEPNPIPELTPMPEPTPEPPPTDRLRLNQNRRRQPERRPSWSQEVEDDKRARLGSYQRQRRICGNGARSGARVRIRSDRPR